VRAWVHGTWGEAWWSLPLVKGMAVSAQVAIG
jgi:hypothetical protein